MRKRERDAEAARGALLDAAAELFARDGFSGARVDEIAEAAGYNKSLIFQYFDDKLGLYRAVVARMKARVEEALGGILAPYIADERPPDAQAVRAFVEEALRWSFNHYLATPRHRRILTWETAEGWKTFNCVPSDSMRVSWMRTLVGFLRRAQDAGILRSDLDVEILLANLLGMTMFYLASLPRFERMFPDAKLSSASALEYAREQIIALILHGTFTPAALAATSPTEPASTPASTSVP